MKKRKVSKRSLFITFMCLLCLISCFFSIYSLSLLDGIETILRITVSAIIIVILLIILLGLFSSLKNKNKKYIIYIPIVLIYCGLLMIFGFYITKTYRVIDNLTSDYTTYSSSLVSLSNNKVNKIKDVKGKVGIVEDKKNIVGNTIPKEVIKEEKLDVDLEEYNSYVDLIKALKEEEVDYVFLPTNYQIMFSTYEGEDFENLNNDTKIIYTKEKKVKNKNTSKSNSLDKPFTILLMGVDSENEEIASSSFNGDSLMLITFNPETLNATILSIPRDTYVPIACFAGKSKSKITHAAWYGEECMMQTIEDFTGIDINYYVKINFKGVVKIVDTLGGIEVDVPYSFCEQNSNREFGDKTIYVEEGLQTLDGEQALAFSRNRHTWPQYCSKKYTNYTSNDFIRGQNQQVVLRAMLNKLKDNGDVNTIYKLLDTVSNSMETNMTTNEILSLYNIGKDVLAKSNGVNFDDAISIQRLYLSGEGATIYDTNVGMRLYNYVIFKESLKEVVKAMKINLGLEKEDVVKEFSFSIDENYEEPVIGMMDSGTTEAYSKSDPEVTNKTTTKSQEEKKTETKTEEVKEVSVPNFIGMTYSEAQSTASKYGLYINVSTTDSSAKVISQDTAAGTKVKEGVTIALTLKAEEVGPTEGENVDPTPTPAPDEGENG